MIESTSNPTFHPSPRPSLSSSPNLMSDRMMGPSIMHVNTSLGVPMVKPITKNLAIIIGKLKSFVKN